MATNAFYPFAAGTGANAETDAAYAADLAANGSLANGFVTGLALSQQVNKVNRQSSIWAAVLGQLIVDLLNVDANDSQSVGTLEANLRAALNSSPALTGTPTAPTAPAGDSSGLLVNTAFLAARLLSYIQTPANNSDATNGRIDEILFNKVIGQPVAFYNGTGYPIVQSDTFGYANGSTVSNMVGSLVTGVMQVNYGAISTNVLLDFAPSAYGSVTNGWYIKIGNIMWQSFSVFAYDGQTVTFPIAFSGTPNVTFISTGTGGSPNNSVSNNYYSKNQYNFSPKMVIQATGGYSNVPSGAPIGIDVTAVGNA